MIEGKVGYRWYLWVFHGREVVVFVLAAGRAHETPEEHLGPDAHGIMVVDRYKAYQAIDQVKKGLIVLAFCWAHVRRDFVGVARTWPEQEGWALAWVEGIGKLYALNDARLAVRQQPAAFADADAALRGAVTALAAQGEAELADPQVHPARRRGAGKPGRPLDGFDGVRRASRGADGQQQGGGACNAGRWSDARTTMVRVLCGLDGWPP